MATEETEHPSPAADTFPECQPMREDIDRLIASIRSDERTHHLVTQHLPDRDLVIRILDHLNELMFPGYFGSREISSETLEERVGELLEAVSHWLAEQISRAFRYQKHVEPGRPRFEQHCAECDRKAAKVVSQFIRTLPEVRRKLSLDVQAAFDGDPAAQEIDEVIFCYPGVRAMTIHRLAHELYKANVPLIPRLMQEHAHSTAGIDIHPGARIGSSFFIDHGTGVVIGETTRIGDHCKIYQSVTLGAKSFPKDERGNFMRGVQRHPTLEDHVTVYAGATILGGDTTIGAGSVVNGGVFLTQSVPPGHIVRGPKLDITLRSNPEMPPANFAI